jgi:hypothetical protein
VIAPQRTPPGDCRHQQHDTTARREHTQSPRTTARARSRDAAPPPGR